MSSPRPHLVRLVPTVLVAVLVVAIAVVASPRAAGAAGLPRAPHGSVRLASDAFGRTVHSGLGRADRGGRYVLRSARGVGVRVSRGAARVAHLGRGRSVRAYLPGTAAANTLVSVVVTVPVAAAGRGGFYFGPELRIRGARMYRAKVYIARGRVGLRIARVNGAADRTLAVRTLSLRVKPGQRLVVQASVTGAHPSLAVRAWRAGHTAPGWQLRYTDSSAAAITRTGAVGTWAYESRLGRSATFSFTGLQVWRLPAPAPARAAAPAPARGTTSTPPSGSGTGATAEAVRGAAPLGSTSYPVPGDALFVSPAGSDSAAGTSAAPLRTVAVAVARAHGGQTVVLRSGTYHDSVVVPAGKAGLVIEAAPGAVVWFDGSTPVGGWRHEGTTWIADGWSARFDHSASFTSGRDDGMAGAQNPMAAWPDGVWVDGTELRQVGSAGAVGPGTFFADYAGGRLVIGTDPTGHQVRASDLAQAIKVSSSHVTLQGFGIRRYATSLPLLGTVRVDGQDNVLRNLIISDNATQGLSFRQSGNLVDHATITGNGMTGIHANVADGLTIRNSIVDANNAQDFNPAPSAAGAKITRSRHLTITNTAFDDNGAAGLWLDQCDVYFTIAGNSFQGDYIGAQLELADTGIVADNVFHGGKYGLYVFDTGNVKVYNNSFAAHPVGAVLMSQDQRRQADATAYQRDGDSRYPAGDPTDPWLLRNVVVADNLFPSDGTDGMFQVYALDKRTHIPADDMKLTITGNYFRHRDSSAQPSMVGWGGSDNVTVTRYETPAALSSAKNGSWHNGQAVAAGNRALTAAATDSIAVPLPADVAAAVGRPAGTRHVGPF